MNAFGYDTNGAPHTAETEAMAAAAASDPNKVYMVYVEYGEETVSFHRSWKGAQTALIARCQYNHADPNRIAYTKTPHQHENSSYCGIVQYDVNY